MTMPLRLAPSRLYYPNSIARILFLSCEHLLGQEGFETLLRGAGLDHFVGHFPPMNLNRQFDFADFSMVMAALDAHAIAIGDSAFMDRVGRGTYKLGLQQFGGIATVGGALLGIKMGDAESRVRIGLQAMAGIFSTFSDQKTEIVERADRFEYRLVRCPICWGRQADHVACAMGVGLLAEGLAWVLGRGCRIEETSCHAMGSKHCVYTVYKDSLEGEQEEPST